MQTRAKREGFPRDIARASVRWPTRAGPGEIDLRTRRWGSRPQMVPGCEPGSTRSVVRCAFARPGSRRRAPRIDPAGRDATSTARSMKASTRTRGERTGPGSPRGRSRSERPGSGRKARPSDLLEGGARLAREILSHPCALAKEGPLVAFEADEDEKRSLLRGDELEREPGSELAALCRSEVVALLLGGKCATLVDEIRVEIDRPHEDGNRTEPRAA